MSDLSHEHGALGSSLRRLLDLPDLRERGRRLFGGAVEAVVAGWPRRLSPELARNAFRGPEVAIELARVPLGGEHRMSLVLGSAIASRLVDRMLGGSGHVGVSTPLTGAEQGMLAYATAHLCAAARVPWLVRDVQPASAEALFAEFPNGVMWPLSMETQFGALEARVVLSEPAAQAQSEPITLLVTLADELPDGELSAAEPGDLVAGDWPLTSTVRGLVGPVELQLLGSDERFAAIWEAGTLRAHGLAPAKRDRGRFAELVIARCSLPFASVADLSAGRALVVRADAMMELRHAGKPLLEGKPVVHRGRLGLRVSRVHSMR